VLHVYTSQDDFPLGRLNVEDEYVCTLLRQAIFQIIKTRQTFDERRGKILVSNMRLMRAVLIQLSYALK